MDRRFSSWILLLNYVSLENTAWAMLCSAAFFGRVRWLACSMQWGILHAVEVWCATRQDTTQILISETLNWCYERCWKMLGKDLGVVAGSRHILRRTFLRTTWGSYAFGTKRRVVVCPYDEITEGGLAFSFAPRKITVAGLVGVVRMSSVEELRK